MQNRTALLIQLSQAVTQLQTAYRKQESQIVYAKFDPMVFSENYQPVKFYLKELNYSLAQLHQLSDANLNQALFLTEKLLAQCTALSDALTKPNNQEKQSAVNFQPKLNAREKRKQALEKLPPRERLDAYYDALNALNNKLNEQKDHFKQTQSDLEKTHYATLIEQTRVRRQRCLEAIEILEEYLAYKEGQE